MILTGGVGNWRQLSTIDYPLPEAIALVIGKSNALTKIFASIGLFGLIASFHGTILASSRQVYAMARSGYLPAKLSIVNSRFKTPHWALVAGGFVSLLALLTGTTSQIIILSVLGAIVMYMMSMTSLFILRNKEPDLDRPFIAPFYPVFPAIALVISIICLVAIVDYNFQLSLIFFAGLLIVTSIFVALGKHRIPILIRTE
jgi:ethanolamine permease